MGLEMLNDRFFKLQNITVQNKVWITILAVGECKGLKRVQSYFFQTALQLVMCKTTYCNLTDFMKVEVIIFPQ